MAGSLFVPNNIEDITILKRFLTDLTNNLNNNPFITVNAGKNELGTVIANALNSSNVDFLATTAKIAKLQNDIKMYIANNLETVIKTNSEDLAAVVEQFGSYYDQALAAAWYGLTIKTGNIISGFTLGGLDKDTSTPGTEGSFFAINADSFTVAKAVEDISNPEEVAYLEQHGLPYGTMFNANTGSIIPAFVIDWDGNQYNIFFNGKVEFTNLAGNLTVSQQQAIDTANLINNAGFTSDASLEDFITEVYTPFVDEVQASLDNEITSWFYDYTPTLLNEPASLWLTNNDKDRHLGDLFYDTLTGNSYRFVYSNSIYSWNLLADSGIALALQQASLAKDTADNKRRVFIAEPVAPYDIGDLYVPLETNGNFKEKDIYVCIVAKELGQSFNEVDFTLATAYSILSEGLITLTNELGVISNSVDGKVESFYQISMPHNEATIAKTNTESVNIYDAFVKDIWYDIGLDRKTYIYIKSDNGLQALTNGLITDISTESESFGDIIAVIYEEDDYGNITGPYEETYTYHWVETPISKELFDTLDGKKAIFVSRPSSYNERDIWIPSVTQTHSNIVFNANEVYIARYSRTTFTASDWAIATKYTDDTVANAAKAQAYEALQLLSDIAADDKLTPDEKKSVLKEVSTIQIEYPGLITEAETYNVTAVNYTNSYNSLIGYISVFLLDLTTTNTIDRVAFIAKFTSYYNYRNLLKEAITASAATSAAWDTIVNRPMSLSDLNEDDEKRLGQAESDASDALDLLADIAADNRVTASEKLLVQKEWLKIKNEYTIYIADALAHNVTSSTYTAKYNALNSYITPLLSNLTLTEVIDRAQFNAVFTEYYTQRENLIVAISTDISNVADSAVSAIALITSDNVLSAAEKPAIRREWEVIAAEKPIIVSQANTYGVVSELSDYEIAYSSLGFYLNDGVTLVNGTIPSWINNTNISTNTNIIGSTFRTYFNSYYAKRFSLINAINEKTGIDPDTIYYTGTTEIDGAKIRTGTITADRIQMNTGWAGVIYNSGGTAANYKMKIDFTNGSIYIK